MARPCSTGGSDASIPTVRRQLFGFPHQSCAVRAWRSAEIAGLHAATAVAHLVQSLVMMKRATNNMTNATKAHRSMDVWYAVILLVGLFIANVIVL
jgi:hypothetical protein